MIVVLVLLTLTGRRSNRQQNENSTHMVMVMAVKTMMIGSDHHFMIDYVSRNGIDKRFIPMPFDKECLQNPKTTIC